MIVSKAEISKALRSSTICYDKNDDRIRLMATVEMELANAVYSIHKLVCELARTSEISFVINGKSLAKNDLLKITNLGKQFLIGLRANTLQIKSHYPIHAFTPTFDLFVRATSSHLASFPDNFGSPRSSQSTDCVLSLTNSIQTIRSEYHTKEFRNKMNDFNRLANKNHLGLNKYIDGLLDRHSNLLVMRIDFGYIKENGWLDGGTTSVQCDEARDHRKKLARYITEKLPTKSIVGFAWKLEYSLNKSFHYAYLLFSRPDLDGGGDSDHVVNLIGNHWNNTITKGKGLYYDCSRYANGYKKFGVGNIQSNDPVARNNLRKAALYLTKKDDFIKLLVPENGRSFDKGDFR